MQCLAVCCEYRVVQGALMDATGEVYAGHPSAPSVVQGAWK
jgi:hypothetical protein